VGKGTCDHASRLLIDRDGYAITIDDRNAPAEGWSHTGQLQEECNESQERRQRAMLQNAFSIQPFEAKRVRFESTRPFDEVLLNLRKLVGTAILFK